MGIVRDLARPVVRAAGLHDQAARYARWESRSSIRLVNFLFQRLLGLNRDCPFPVNFTSRVNVPRGLDVHPSVRSYFATSGGCYFQAVNGISLGEGTIFAPGVKMISADHDTSDLAAHVPGAPIAIGRRCWIGANAVVLPGTRLGDDVVVGAGAVVKGEFPPRCVIAGVPARIIRQDGVRTAT